MDLYGLIGYPLRHSFSVRYFSEKFKKEKIVDSSYRNFSLERIEDFTEIIEKYPDLSGLNVTIPYKEKIIEYLDEVDDTAKKIGAVNTISIKNIDGQKYLKGYNTDAPGFMKALRTVLNPEIKSALILGTGGASKAIDFALQQADIKTIFVSRTPTPVSGEISYANLNADVIHENLLIVNTSPLGTFPNSEECPNIPYNLLSGKHILFDLVYNPERTLFMKKGQERGAKTSNGYMMLVNQAEESWKIWNS